MNTSSEDTFDWVIARCDNNLNNNFWPINKWIWLRKATVILRKDNLSLPSCLYTHISCTDAINSKWIYKNIYVK